jgi:hypothetical protein
MDAGADDAAGECVVGGLLHPHVQIVEQVAIGIRRGRLQRAGPWERLHVHARSVAGDRATDAPLSVNDGVPAAQEPRTPERVDELAVVDLEIARPGGEDAIAASVAHPGPLEERRLHVLGAASVGTAEIDDGLLLEVKAIV